MSMNNNESAEEYALRPWSGRAIIHLDLDAFFAAAAQLDHPELRGLPVIVGGDAKHRGVVSTASYEARAFGVHSAMSSARAQQLCPQAVWVKSDFDRYHELSARVFHILRDYTPLMERTSIDEAYADITPDIGHTTHPAIVCLEIQKRICALGLTASIGLGTSKTIAKIGSDYLKPRGLTVIEPGKEREFLSSMPIEKMGGIGKSTAKKLKSIGIATLGDLSKTQEQDVRHILGNSARRMIDRASGIDPSEIVLESETKSISNEHTFDVDTDDKEVLCSELTTLSEKVGWRLRKEHLSGRTITVKVKFSDFTTKTISKTFSNPLNDEAALSDIAKNLLIGSDSLKRSVRLLGVGVSNFTRDEVQLSLDDFASVNDEVLRKGAGREQLVKGMDEIREKFGYASIGSGTGLLMAKQDPEKADPAITTEKDVLE
ncbi:MAG: DNA polymerase IV [Coriobacteriia bacterium]|nr:DNA polymerase IV [Coriobacteriia bacterium]